MHATGARQSIRWADAFRISERTVDADASRAWGTGEKKTEVEGSKDWEETNKMDQHPELVTVRGKVLKWKTQRECRCSLSDSGKSMELRKTKKLRGLQATKSGGVFATDGDGFDHANWGGIWKSLRPIEAQVGTSAEVR